MKAKRSGGVELFRCLLMFVIVLYHTWYHGIFGPDDGMMGLKSWWIVLFQALLIWHVDGFVAISGWFGIRFSWRKFLMLYGVILFYSLFGIVMWRLIEPDTFGLYSIQVSGGWFGGSYLMLMLLAPILNAAIEGLKNTGRKHLIIAMSLVVFGMFCNWFPRNLLTAINPTAVGSCTFFGMVFVYLIARSCHELFTSPIPLRKLLIAGLVFPIGIVFCAGYGSFSHITHHLPLDGTVLNALASYSAPHVWLFAIVLLMIFLWYVPVPEWIAKICKFVGPSTFGIYLIHDVVHVGKYLYWIPEKYMFGTLGLHPAICIVLSAIITFSLCLLIDIVRRVLIRGFKSKMSPLLDWIDYKWMKICG